MHRRPNAVPIYEMGSSGLSGHLQCDVLVIPLSFDGDRAAVYARPPARAVIVHDWIWRVRGTSRLVSPWLLKRLNLVRG